MTVTQTIFMAWGLFCGGAALIVASLTNKVSRRSAAKLLTKDEARRIAANVAKLPELAHLLPSLAEL
jgi:hypothetical protein